MTTGVRRRLPSLRGRLLALVLAVAIPATGLVTYAIVDSASSERDFARRQLQTLADTVANRLENLLRDNEAHLARIAERPLVKALDPKRCDPIVAEFVELNPHYTTLAIRDRAGNAVCSYLANPASAAVISRFPWFTEALRREEFTVGGAFLGHHTGRWVSVLTYPVRDASTRIAGLAVLPLDLQKLQERVFQAMPPEALIAVLDRDNRFLMRSADASAWIGKPLPATQVVERAGRRDGVLEAVGVDGVNRMSAVVAVPASGWLVFVALPSDVISAPHRERLARSVAAGLLVLAGALLVAWRIGSGIARPIDELARAASSSASGGPGRLDPDTVTAEVDALAGHLTRLVGERDLERGARAALEVHYGRMLQAARDIYLLIDEDGKVVDFNDAAVAAYGYRPDELRGMAVIDLRAPQARAALALDWRKSAGPGGALYETVHRRRDGSTFPVEASTRPVEIDGRTYRQALVRDITVRKADEDILRRQNVELDRFNRAAVGRELEVIALKRQVNGLAQDLGRQPPYPLAFLDGPDPTGTGEPRE